MFLARTLRRVALAEAAEALPSNLSLPAEYMARVAAQKVAADAKVTELAARPALQLPVTPFLGDAAEATATAELDPFVFTTPLRVDILHRCVVWQQAKKRAGLRATKTITQVSGTTKKQRPQKGTGRARMGNLRSPHLRRALFAARIGGAMLQLPCRQAFYAPHNCTRGWAMRQYEFARVFGRGALPAPYSVGGRRRAALAHAREKASRLAGAQMGGAKGMYL